MTSIELKIPPLALFLAFGGFMYTVPDTLPAADVEIPYRRLLAVMVGGIGAGFSAAGIAAFRRANTTVNPTTPEAASTMVTSGVYQISRNPMYAGFLLMLLAEAILLSNLAAFLLLPAFVAHMNRFQIKREERALQDKFGNAFIAYRNTVRRWL